MINNNLNSREAARKSDIDNNAQISSGHLSNIGIPIGLITISSFRSITSQRRHWYTSFFKFREYIFFLRLMKEFFVLEWNGKKEYGEERFFTVKRDI